LGAGPNATSVATPVLEAAMARTSAGLPMTISEKPSRRSDISPMFFYLREDIDNAHYTQNSYFLK
jgi:hypothetical protein